MSIRIGLHHGSVIVEGERMFGDSVNTAARMATFAMQEQIITTEETVRRLSRDAEAMARKFDVIKVKGKRDGITVYSIHWREDASATMFESVPPQSVDTSTKLSLLYHGERIQVAPDTEIFSMGRSDECDLAVEGALVSRLHARFEFHRGKILLIDQSTNGTYVRTNDGGKFFLRREGLPVWGKGIIGLGAPIDEENPHTVEFEFA